jgi:hypothetical protein
MAISLYGKGGSGSTRSVTKAISRGISTTSTSIRSSMASYHACATGRIHRFIGMCGKVCCPMTGQVMPAQMEQISVNGPNGLCSPHERRVGAKRRPMTGSATCGEFVAPRISLRSSGLQSISRSRADCGHDCVGAEKRQTPDQAFANPPAGPASAVLAAAATASGYLALRGCSSLSTSRKTALKLGMWT